MAKKTVENEELEDDPKAKKFRSPTDILAAHLKTNKNQFNTVVTADTDYLVSMGSLKLDAETEGGLPAGIHRFMGVSEGGKSSEAIEVMDNFLATVPNARGIYVKAEGRLGKQVKARAASEFLETSEELAQWRSGDGKGVRGNIFVYKNNIYDDVVSLLENLIEERDGTKYCVIIDSLDALNLQADVDKATSNRGKKDAEGKESEKVAGAPLMTKLFFKRMSLPITELGHMVLLISQVSTSIKIGYSKEPERKVSGTGGNAAMHFASYIFDFQPRFNGDLILKDPKLKPDSETNPILGHWAKCIVRKSTNEKSELMYRYPIKYRMTNGKSIWKSFEVVDLMLSWGLVARGGSWFTFEPEALEIMENAGISVDTVKIQGLPKLQSLFDEDQNLCIFWYNYLRDMIIASGVDVSAKDNAAGSENDEIL